MPLDFPDSTIQQTYLAPNGTTYIWNGTSWVVSPVLPASRGGTGFTTYNHGDILYGDSSKQLNKLAAGTSGQALFTAGVGADPYWGTVSTGQTIAVPAASKLLAFYPGTATSLTGSTGIEYTNSSSLLMTLTARTNAQQTLKVTGTPTSSSVPIFSVDGSDNSQFLIINSIAGQNGIVAAINPSNASATWALLVNNSSQDTRFQVDTKDNLVQLKKGTQLQLFEGAGNYYSGFKATSATANTTYVLPPTTPASGTSVLQSDASGVMSWVQMSSGGGAGTVSIASVNEIAGYYAGAGSSVKGSSTFTNDITNGTVAIGHTTNSTTVNSGALTVAGGVGIGGSLFVGGTSVSLFQNVANNYVYFNTGTNVLRIQTDVATARVRMFENMTTGTLGFFGTSGGTLYLGTDSGTNNGNITIRGNNTTGGGGNVRAASFTLATATSNGSGMGGTLIFQTSTSGNPTANLTNALRTRLRIEGAATGTSNLESIIVLGESTSGTAWTSYLRGVDASGTDVAAGEIQIQAGRSTGTGNAQGISFYVSPSGTTSSTLNTANQIARFSGTGLTIFSSTSSTSTTTGALIVAGGVGIGGSLNVGSLSEYFDHVEIKTAKELRFYNSADTQYIGIKAGNVASSNKTFTLPLDYGNDGQFLTSDGSGTLNWRNAPVQVSSGNANQIAYYASSGNTVSGSSTFTNDATGGVVSITHNTASSSTITGALVLSGGLGLAGNLYGGGLASFSGNISSNGSASSFTNNAGSLTITNRVIKSGSIQLSYASGIGTEGSIFSVRRANVRDTSGSSYSLVPVNSFKKPSLSSSAAGQVYTVASTLYIEDAPDSSTTGAFGTPVNTVTITNPYALYVESGRTFLGGSIVAGGTGFTKTLGNGDIALDNGTVDTPGLLMYWGNNRNISIDTFYSGAGTTRFRIVKELNETGGAELWSVDRNGIVTQTAWAVGETIKTQTYNYSELSMSGTDPNSITSSSYTTIATASFTPLSSSSYLWIEFSATYDYNGGTSADEFAANIEVGGTEIINVFQKFINGSGGGTRSGVLFPLSGRYTNTGTSALTITVRVKRNSGDDPIRIFGNAGSGLMRIQEIGR